MFRKITIFDKPLFDQFQCPLYCGSELQFANVFAWKKTDDLELACFADFLIIKGHDFFFPPLCKSKDAFQKGIKWIEEYATTTNFPFRLLGITTLFLSFFNDEYVITPDPNLDEYLYLPSDLSTYPGKKFHAKRNLCNQFKNNYSYQFLTYQNAYFSDVIDLCNRWEEHKTPTEELQGITDILNNLDASGCFCDVLFVEEKIEAFVIGCIHKNCGIVLFEKANVEFIGIYPMIVSLTSQKHFQHVEFVNRQEDMGIESLRQAKLRFHPVDFIKKYQISWNKDKQLRYLYQSSFPDSLDYVDYFFTKKEKDTLVWEENNFIYAVLHFRKVTLNLFNQLHPACFIFAISTHPFYRKHGYISKLLTATLKKWQNEFVCCFLHPDIDGFYEKFNFVPCCYLAKHSTLTRIKTNDWEQIKILYNQYANSFPNFIVRSDKQWLDLQEELIVNHGTSYLLYDQTKLCGYELYDGEQTIELVDLSKSQENKIKYNMIRLLNISFFKIGFPELKDNLINDPLLDHLTSSPSVNILTIDEFSQLFIDKYPILILDRY